MEIEEANSKLKTMPPINENLSEVDKLAWLRSQVIGRKVAFDTPFGSRILTYADHTASGRCLHYVEDYIIDQILPFYGNTHTTDSFVGSKTTQMVNEAVDYIKSRLGAGDKDSLIFCGSGTTAAIKRLQETLGIAVPSVIRERVVKSLKDEERWVVFVGPYEHHSNILSWRQSLAEVVEIGFDREGLIDMEELKTALESTKYVNRPMLGSFSACSNVTGIVTDTRAVSRLLHQHGAFACFDFAASGPYVKIEMRSGDIEGYDAVFLSPHKFLGGPGTPGILVMNKALYQLKESPPSTCGGGTVGYVNGFNDKDTLYYDDIEEREDGGTPPIIQKIRAALAFWVKEYVGYEFIDLYESFYIEAAFDRLLPHPNISVLGRSGHVKRLPILSFLVYPPQINSQSNMDNRGGSRDDYNMMSVDRYLNKCKPLNGRFVAKLLNDLFGIQARGGCGCAGPYGHYLLGVDKQLSLRIRSLIEKGYYGVKPGWTRISFSYYMSKDEFVFILDCIEFIAAYGHRFLPLYQLDWATGDWTFKTRALKHHVMKEETFLSSGLFGKSNAAAGLKQLGERDREEGTNKSSKNSGMANRYRGYLETAHQIALSLPSYHPSTSFPEDVDPNMILFIV